MIATLADPPFATGLAPRAGTLPAHISPTAAKTYLGCPLRFWFERVACIRRKTPVNLHLGKAVHAALQSFHLARWRGGDDSPEAVAAAFEKALADLERDEGPVNFRNPAERDKTRLDGLRVKSPPADAHRKRRVIALLETAVEGIASDRFHPQPGMSCSWCAFRRECLGWPAMEGVERRAA